METLLESVRQIAIKDYEYALPENRIAVYPVEPRDACKLLLYRHGLIGEDRFAQVADYLPEGGMLVYNNTKVIRARLFFRKETGAQIEIFCLEPHRPSDYAQNFQAKGSCEWVCLVGNLKKWKSGPLVRDLQVGGQTVRFTAEHMGAHEHNQLIRFSWTPGHLSFGDLLEQAGIIPIPPYLRRESEKSDETTYQTVYSRIVGSVAAPTAGLHFTDETLQRVDRQGIVRREVTLHVSASTFAPVKSEQMDGHPMHLEFLSVERSLLDELIRYEGRITAVGTTSVRTLESLYWFGVHCLETPSDDASEGLLGDWVLDQWYPYREHRPFTMADSLQALAACMDRQGLTTFHASTRLLIAPGYTYRVVNAMITNFHQPESTLLLLVAAFIGDDWRKVYDYALANGFRFLSYGDGSLLIP